MPAMSAAGSQSATACSDSLRGSGTLGRFVCSGDFGWEEAFPLAFLFTGSEAGLEPPDDPKRPRKAKGDPFLRFLLGSHGAQLIQSSQAAASIVCDDFVGVIQQMLGYLYQPILHRIAE